MSTQTVGTVPAWTLGDRLRKARAETSLSASAFAAEIGLSRATVLNAESGKHAVRPITLNAWAMRTGVPRTWLETGIAPQPEPEGDGVRQEGVEPPTRWLSAPRTSAGRGMQLVPLGVAA